MEFLVNILGYILNFFYELVHNYGFAIILFSVLIKLILLPISIKQQKTMKKSAKLNAELKKIQSKYMNNPEKLNAEMISLYKREKMSPFTGCLSGIVQIVIILAVFFLVKSPLTYMKKVDVSVINEYKDNIQQESKENMMYPEISIIKDKGNEDERVYINMEFLGLDLSDIPNQNLGDWRVYVIPVLYVMTSFITMKLTTSMQTNIGKDAEETNEQTEMDAALQANKSMMYLMPIMSVSISIIAPLGLALYWLVGNVLAIVERLILNRFLKEEEN